MSITYWKFKFRKNAVWLFSTQFAILFCLNSFYQIQTLNEQKKQKILLSLFHSSASKGNQFLDKKNGHDMQENIWLNEFAFLLEGGLARMWEVKDFTSNFIKQLEGKKYSELQNIRMIVKDYFDEAVKIPLSVETKSLEIRKLRDIYTDFNTLITDSTDYLIVEKIHRHFGSEISSRACIEQIKKEVRVIEFFLLYYLRTRFHTLWCGYILKLPIVKAKKQLFQEDTLHLTVHTVKHITQYYQLILENDTLEIDNIDTPVYKFKPQCIGNHTLEGVILKKDGWGRIKRYPFEHHYSVLPK